MQNTSVIKENVHFKREKTFLNTKHLLQLEVPYIVGMSKDFLGHIIEWNLAEARTT